MFCGLDLSTTVAGYCFLDDSGLVVEAGHVTFSKQDNLYQRLRVLLDVLERLCRKREIEYIFVEEAAKVYSGGSSAHIMALLQRWNGMVCAGLAVRLGIDAELIEAREARKAAGIKLPGRAKKKETKPLIVEQLKQRNVLPDSIWEYKRTGSLKDHCFDIADAYVIAHAGYLSHRSYRVP